MQSASPDVRPGAVDDGRGLGLLQPLAKLPTPSVGGAKMPAWAWLAIIGFCIAAALPVVQSSNVTESGARLLQLEAERERLKSDVRQLSAHLGELASLGRIEAEAQSRINMVHASPTIVIDVDAPPPAQVMPSRYLPVIETEPQSEPPSWQGVLDFLIFR